MGTKTKINTGLTIAFLTIITILLTFPQVVNAVTQEWVRRYDGPAKWTDHAYAIAVDTKGNVYVTGTSVKPFLNHDYATIKYNSAGNRQWVRRYDGPGKSRDNASAIAVDNNGNVYVTGGSINAAGNYDYATIKYNSAGIRQWVRRYDGPGKDDDYANAIAVDTGGNVYVTGASRNAAGYEDYATIKYNTDGRRQWVRRYDGPGKFGIRNDEPTAIAVDTNGNVYVTGSSRNAALAPNDDYATIKYNSAGKRQWVRRYDGPGKWYDYATAIAVDTKGNVYVTGCSRNVTGNDDYATIKYSSTGKQQWIGRYNGPRNGDDCATAIAVDTKGNAYVTGYSRNVAGNDDYATIKYSSSGKREWVRRYDGPGKGYDFATAIAVDIRANVYVTGYSRNLFGNDDYATIKYNNIGNQQWIKRYDGPGKWHDYATAIAVDTRGNVYVTGYSNTSGVNDDYATIKYAP